MKKMIIALAMILTGSITSLAANPQVNKEVLAAFAHDFSTATEVHWTSGGNYFKALFVFNGRYISAYYNENGELYGVIRHISSPDLPLQLLMSLKKNYSQYWITDLFELAKNSGSRYYITLEYADSKIILKSSDSNEWSVYKKIKKS